MMEGDGTAMTTKQAIAPSGRVDFLTVRDNIVLRKSDADRSYRLLGLPLLASRSLQPIHTTSTATLRVVQTTIQIRRCRLKVPSEALLWCIARVTAAEA